MRFLTKRMLLMAVALGIWIGPGQTPVQAGFLNLLSSGAEATAGDAIFIQGVGPGGTGNTNTFAEIGSNTDVIHGYNTTVDKVLDNGSSDVFNHEIKWSDVSVIQYKGELYFEFKLDINENSGGTSNNKYLSLDKLQVYVSNTPNQKETDPSKLGTLVYDLDKPTDNTILLDFQLGSGSGTEDMVFLLKYDPVLDAANQFVYLYSQFGGLGSQNGSTTGVPAGNYANSDGFEHWGLRSPVDRAAIPVPPSIILAAIGMFPLIGWGRRRKKNLESSENIG